MQTGSHKKAQNAQKNIQHPTEGNEGMNRERHEPREQ
jgi:hypothetical protein